MKVGHAKYAFGEGAERFVFRCYEFKAGETSLSEDTTQSITRVGPRLVAKESKHQVMLNPKPKNLNPKPYSLFPKPYTLA